MTYTLKHKNIDAATLEFSDGGDLLKIKEVRNAGHLPLSVVREDGKIMNGRLIEWWNSRGIPKTRDSFAEVLREAGIVNKNKLLVECNGLSLTDHYWVSSEMETKKWEEINFYDNNFDRDIGDLFFNIRKKNKNYSRRSPDAASEGDLRKQWIIADDGTRVLLKAGRKPYLQEPCNEVIAGIICGRLGIPHVSYFLQGDMNDPLCECSNMTNPETEFIDANSIYYTIEPNAFQEDFYNHYSKCSQKLQAPSVVPMLDRMMILDYIMLNHDRHFKNFGILRNSETLGDIRAAPIFDTGSSLFHEDSKNNIVLPERPGLRVKCFDELEKQLDLVKDWRWFDGGKLKGIGDECRAVFEKVPSVEKERIEKIVPIIETRIRQVEQYLVRIHRPISE